MRNGSKSPRDLASRVSQRQADKAYRLFAANPASLALKKVGLYWSARISLEYCVLGYQKGNEFF